jgi:hypothetical protein
MHVAAKRSLAVVIGTAIGIGLVAAFAWLLEGSGLGGLISLLVVGALCGVLAMILILIQVPTIATSRDVSRQIDELREEVNRLRAGDKEDSPDHIDAE